MSSFTIKTLFSGGIITNYHCSSKCRHCLYACSPKRNDDYMSAEMATRIFKKLKSMGCYSIHIGGGEPFLNPDGLEKVLETARTENINVDYVETNSSWFRDIENAVDILLKLKKAGLTTLLISISPFHNEFVPFRKVKGVMSACHRTGLSVFPWIYEFFNEMDELDENKTHTLEEYRRKFGNNYVNNIPNRYWVHFGGRALNTYKSHYKQRSVDEILKEYGPCKELTDTSHFHFDLYGNYIPGLCSGLSIKMDDIGKEITQAEYPFISILHQKGISGLMEMAKTEYNFQPQENYFSKCHLCYDIRKHLVTNKGVDSHELRPNEFYNSEE